MQPFDLSAQTGLTDVEVSARLERDGYNELPASKPRNLLAIAAEVVREPMFLLLVATGSLYLLLGDLTEGLLLLAFVLVVMGITLYQQRKTERALEALRDLSSPRALVIRNGGAAAHPGPRGGARRPRHAGGRGPRAGRRPPAGRGRASRWTSRC